MSQQVRSTRCLSLGAAWEELRRVRTTIEDYFADSSEDLRHAATMAALELAENVLKHGADRGSGLVTMAEENGEVVICSQNRVDSVKTAQAVRQRIQRIAEKGARELYVNRMLEIMEQPDSSDSGLGLLRIAYEGAFQLNCEILGDILRIQARRRLNALPS
jgi:hypothetical protein